LFGLGMPELMTIMVIALVIFGPRKLPEIGRTAGKFIREFRQASQQIENQVKMEFRESERQEREAEKEKKEVKIREEVEKKNNSEEAKSKEIKNEEETKEKETEAGGSC